MLENKIMSLYDRKSCILGHESFFKSSVLVPLIRIDDEWCILFQKRSLTIKRQPGEISFPGGEIEACDAGPRQAAVRESYEELGLGPEDINLIADLDIFVSPFNMIVYPFLAIIQNPQKIQLDPLEVERVFYVPLNFLLQYRPQRTFTNISISYPDDFPLHLIPAGKDYPFRPGIYPQCFYIWEEEVIWGLTARILTHFLDLIR
ncbi:MAG TPA: CoA pyrophosphatase [Syntrophomonadaceae bacterium]|nr:CoA pyrophosphatase [Syntrophomonadaceae bacterium]